MKATSFIQRARVNAGSSESDVLKKLVSDLGTMTPQQIATLTRGIVGIRNFYTYNGFAAFNGDMLVKAASPRRSTVVELTLAMNAMRWLTKFYFKDVVSGFSALYRVHSFPRDSVVDTGSTVDIVPRKPMLSWTDNKGIKPSDIGYRGMDKKGPLVDYLISMQVSSKDVIWSYKFAEWETPLKSALKTCQDNKVRKPITSIVEALWDLIELNSGLSDEREVTVYCGNRSFGAKILKKF